MALWQKGVRMAAGRMPKLIKPTTHALLDYVVAGSFLLMGALLWKRNRRAATSSLLCGGLAAANIMLTDYPGGKTKVIRYQTHGHIDRALVGLSAAIPRLMQFEDEPEAKFFELEAVANTAVAGLTDYDYYERQAPEPRRSDDVDTAIAGTPT